MARTAGDLALALDAIAGPDEEREGIGYRLALKPARYDDLKSFRVLMIDSHPLMPTGAAVRTALDRLSDRLAKAGVKLAHASSLLPDLSNTTRTYVRLLFAYIAAVNFPPAFYDEARRAAETLAPSDDSLTAERIRGSVMSHRDWIAARVARAQLQQQ